MKQAFAVFWLTMAVFAEEQTATFDRPGYESPLPILLEVGTFHHGVTNGQGYWRGADATLWLRHNPRFTPVFMFNSQTRPGVTQQNIGFFSFANWTKNFYTTQGFSATPKREGFSIFPQQRVDFRGFYKTPFVHRGLVLSAGFTHFSLGRVVKGNMYSTGFILYKPRTIIEGNYFVNVNQPGTKIGSSASLSVQRGQEGKQWTGITLSGGKEVYSYIAATPLEVNLNSVSAQIFLRKWITRHYGYYVSFDHQTRFTAFSRTGATARMFFEF